MTLFSLFTSIPALITLPILISKYGLGIVLPVRIFCAEVSFLPVKVRGNKRKEMTIRPIVAAAVNPITVK